MSFNNFKSLLKVSVSVFGLIAGGIVAYAQSSEPTPLSPTAKNNTTSKTPLLIEGKHSLYQRIITRPGGIISPEPSQENSKPLEGFKVFYVYQRHKDDQGKEDWIQVGTDLQGHIAGWIPVDKSINWSHTLVGAFTNPAGRERSLFLKTEQDEKQLITDPDTAQKAKELTQAALSGNSDKVVAMEPTNYVDITKNFYLLPILDAQQIERPSGPPLRLLHVISAPTQTGGSQVNASPANLRNFKANLVFVMDTTISMEPYIEETQKAVKSIVSRIQNTAVKDNFRFGLVAYRDSLNDNPDLEYETKVFAKPDFSKPIDVINDSISIVHDASVSSKSYDEDPIAGIKTALDEIDWDQAAGRYIILVTDAGARGADHPNSITKLGIEEIHQLAESKGVAVFVVHLLTPSGQKNNNHSKAEKQYRALSKYGTAGSLYFPVKGGTPEAFAEVIQTLSTSLLQQVSNTTGRPVAGLNPDTKNAKQQAIQKQLQVVSQAMKLAYVGKEEKTSVPDVVSSYTTDRDLTNPIKKSVEVRVLLTRNQLSDLAQALQIILKTGLAGRTEPQTFFTQLRSAFAAAARDPSKIAQSQQIGGMLGEYLQGLPYKSDIMNISEKDWLAMGAIAQRTILNNVESRLRLYQEYQAHPDLWVNLNGSNDPGEAVYPVPLEALP
ncbi:vWA domain-containing protein [Commensalibacter papalotli (ex Servin-Garciduenas et al. 2014)]|uniref:Serine/threonine protein kinase PpkA n=1 Tax=Commensalibacter papalotli (ex Servin-Garciduenas et al. 2014) TaxID=1208583 RepID=W7DV23_9PROT|nr:vWA domain-containing protein [Commensalibacter papalotli (ex Servin-Garciduenas et al. 2014)]EUK18865.1 serine/threonine protein kinase PpkA [Commensalibacter papalotli (ex Servin-Garciduenas et al. 2014)]